MFLSKNIIFKNLPNFLRPNLTRRRETRHITRDRPEHIPDENRLLPHQYLRLIARQHALIG